MAFANHILNSKGEIMKNREMVDRLSNEEFAQWILTDGKEIANNYYDPVEGLTKWLDSEYLGWIRIKELNDLSYID